ncbi:class I SAM-dependent methyltransferase [Halorientalis halophila]|uniref:class I SAM-dependent methyltransferase n=1 Tax=Halorientalis halophila TaxID=3108499 RepID=UPI0030096456
MPVVEPFEDHTDRYDRWFETHEAAYESELAAVRAPLPTIEPDRAVEVGVGSGQFAAPLDVGLGVDPSPAMLRRARDRGVTPIQGVAESLPLRDDSVSTVVLVTTICFVDDVERTLAEAHRVLGPGGTLAVGFVARDGPLGERYREKQCSNPFYQDATFVAVPDLLDAMAAAGFVDWAALQTLFSDPASMDLPDPVREGWGDGSFVVVSGRVPD